MFKLYLKISVMMCVILNSSCSAHLHEILDIIDLPSLDLANFQYFKNLPSQNQKTAAGANLFIEHFQKKKAVLNYLEHLFLGNSLFAAESDIVFDPNFGRAWRPHFERKYGWRGERLIAVLGQGRSLQQLKQFDAIPKEFGGYYYPS